MKGAKRILSVFLLVMMLCTFFAFPIEALSVDFNVSKFTILENSAVVATATNGAKYFRSDLTKPVQAYLDLSGKLEPGGTYRFNGSITAWGVRDLSYVYVLIVNSTGGDLNLDDSLLVFSGDSTSNKVYPPFDVVVKIPDNFTHPVLYVTAASQVELYLNDFRVADESTDKGILNSIKEGFSKLWEWLQNIWNTIKEIPAKIGQFITNLGDRISTFFSNLTNSIKGFFTDLWDKIWNGDGSVPPFDNNNKFAQVIEKLNEWTAKIKEFSGSVDSSADTVTGYLQSGTSFLNSAMGAFPAALTAVLGFALVFIVVRKVVGR